MLMVFNIKNLFCIKCLITIIQSTASLLCLHPYIKMPRRGSVLKQFLLDGLINQMYRNLFWVIENEKVFALSCTHKSNRTWIPEEDKIYEDWVKVKTKGLMKKTKCSDPRQRLRVAMSKSHFLNFIKTESNCRIYQFVEDCDVLLSGSDGSLSDSNNATSSYLYEDNTESMLNDINLQKFQDIGGMLKGNEFHEILNIDDVALAYNVEKEVPTNDSQCLEKKNNCSSKYPDITLDMNFDDIFSSSPPLNSKNDFVIDDKLMKDLEDLLKTTENENDLNGICSEQLIAEVDTSIDVGVANQCSTAMPTELCMELSLTEVTQCGDYFFLVGKKVT